MKIDLNRISGALFGLCIGDALGVPVEFLIRDAMKKNPVKDFIGYGTHHQPPGTWSDDSSLTFCLAESLCDGFDLKNIADNFCKWLYEGFWTPFGHVFDIGMTTKQAISDIRLGLPLNKVGNHSEMSNGNGSLMRILPLFIYIHNKDLDEQMQITSDVSSLTHAHPRSIMACQFYILFALEIVKNLPLFTCYQNSIGKLTYYYRNHLNRKELLHFKRLLDGKIISLSENQIKSTGYVVHSLEASIWCLLKNNNYQESVLTAVNLGEDTDTVGAITGGLAGLYYGYDQLPSNWIQKLVKHNEIFKLAEKLYSSYGK